VFTYQEQSSRIYKRHHEPLWKQSNQKLLIFTSQQNQLFPSLVFYVYPVTLLWLWCICPRTARCAAGRPPCGDERRSYRFPAACTRMQQRVAIVFGETEGARMSFACKLQRASTLLTLLLMRYNAWYVTLGGSDRHYSCSCVECTTISREKMTCNTRGREH
jgi:hypothetical protein